MNDFVVKSNKPKQGRRGLFEYEGTKPLFQLGCFSEILMAPSRNPLKSSSSKNMTKI